MLVDGLIILSLHVLEKRMQDTKDKLEQDEAAVAGRRHELDKQTARAEKAALRQQQKAEEKSKKHINNGNTNFAPTHNIQQPDKNKKMR